MRFGTLLMRYRERANKKAYVVSDHLGMKNSQYSAIENGKVGAPKFELCEQLISYLNLTPEEAREFLKTAYLDRTYRKEKDFYQRLGYEIPELLEKESLIPVYALSEHKLSNPELNEKISQIAIDLTILGLAPKPKTYYGLLTGQSPSTTANLYIINNQKEPLTHNDLVVARLMDSIDIVTCKYVTHNEREMLLFQGNGIYENRLFDPQKDKNKIEVYGKVVARMTTFKNPKIRVNNE